MLPRIFAPVILALSVAACDGTRSSSDDIGGPVRVVVTVPDVGHWMQMVGGELVEVDLLVPPGASPHHWQPSASDLRTLADADMAVIVGDAMEPWAERLLAATQRERVDLAILDLVPDGRLRHYQGSHSHGHAHGGEYEGDVDPHIWLSPSLAMIAARGLSDALRDLRPTESASLDLSWESTRDVLQRLIDECARRRTHWRDANGGQAPAIVPMHGAWGYFADELGIEIVDVIEVTPGVEPSPAALRGLVDRMRGGGVAAIVAEPQLNPALAERLGEMTGVPVVTLDPMGSEAESHEEHILGLLDALEPVMTAP